jgi:hypothetical protein
MAKLEKWMVALLPLHPHLPPRDDATPPELRADLKLDNWKLAMQGIHLTARKAGGCGGNDGPIVGI